MIIKIFLILINIIIFNLGGNTDFLIDPGLIEEETIPIVMNNIYRQTINDKISSDNNHNRYLSMQEMGYDCHVNNDSNLGFDYMRIDCFNVPRYLKVYTIEDRNLKIIEPAIDEWEAGQYNKERKGNLIISGNFVYSNLYDTYNGIYISDNPFIFAVNYDSEIPYKNIESIILDEVLKSNPNALHNTDRNNIISFSEDNRITVYTEDYYNKSLGNKFESLLFSYDIYCNNEAKKCIIFAIKGLSTPVMGGKNITYFGKLFPFYSDKDLEKIKGLSGITVQNSLYDLLN